MRPREKERERERESERAREREREREIKHSKTMNKNLFGTPTSTPIRQEPIGCAQSQGWRGQHAHHNNERGHGELRSLKISQGTAIRENKIKMKRTK